MLAFHKHAVESERATAERALELFLTVKNLRWADAYTAAVFERSQLPDRFQMAMQRITKGMPFEQATRAIEGPDAINADVSVRAWGQRGGE